MPVGVSPNSRVSTDGYVGYFQAEVPEVFANLSTSCITRNIQVSNLQGEPKLLGVTSADHTWADTRQQGPEPATNNVT